MSSNEKREVSRLSTRLSRRDFLQKGTIVVGGVVVATALSTSPLPVKALELLSGPDAQPEEVAAIQAEIETRSPVKLDTLPNYFGRTSQIVYQRNAGRLPLYWDQASDLSVVRDTFATLPEKWFKLNPPVEGAISEFDQPDKLTILLSRQNGFVDPVTRNYLELNGYEAPGVAKLSPVIIVHELGGHHAMPITHYEVVNVSVDLRSPWFDKAYEVFGGERYLDNPVELAQKAQAEIDRLFQKAGGRLPISQGALGGDELIRYYCYERLFYGFDQRFPYELMGISAELWYVLGEDQFGELFTEALGDEEKSKKWVDFANNDMFDGIKYQPSLNLVPKLLSDSPQHCCSFSVTART